jgi:peptidoglycan lytic transglycosylase G
VKRLGAVLACALLVSCGPAPNAPREQIIVPKRASLRAVAESLAAHHVIHSPPRFLLVAHLYGLVLPRYRGLDRHLRPGRYEFPDGATTRQILDDMLSGHTKDDFFTVPEGYTTWEIAAAAHEKLGMDTAAFLAATRDSSLRAELGLPRRDRTVEGYLFPDTYRVVFGASPEQLVQQMVTRFEAVWDTAWDARAREEGLTRNQVMTLASIVEAEARLPAERRIIAGVYLNRLKRRHPMKLQADPTVIYALGHHVNRVLLRDLKVRSPYNTYLHAGLPPGPIGSPGRAAILAVLWPAHHDFLYFVARPDGSNMFSVTGAEHADSQRVARRLWAAYAAARRDSILAAQRESTAVRRARRDSAMAQRESTAAARRDSAAVPPVGRDSTAPRAGRR